MDGAKGEGTSEKQILGWNPGGKLQDKEHKYLHDLKTHEGIKYLLINTYSMLTF